MKILITAGPTREYLDDVRYLSNASSGRMGYALAEAALKAGHEVVLVTGPVDLPPPVGCVVHAVETTAQMRDACVGAFPACNGVIAAAAVPGASGEDALVAAAGGRYVEAAVMTSVPPHGIRVPMLLGGAHATEAEKLLGGLGFVAQTVSAELGIASAIKLCRSVVIKGLESLVVESFTAARRLGVEQQVLASLKETYPQFDWEKQGDYLFSRVIQHGKRRAEEMRASAQMIDATGVGGTMAGAAAQRQAAVAAQRAAGALVDPLILKPWRERADEMGTFLDSQQTGTEQR